ncbi:hypothetical protein RGUI_0339 [Rhodovulum sp. P5]|nr:hypothetical protein RGUI_0339 [Rhodovulum sp. P5]
MPDLEEFVGDWTLTREIRDAYAGQNARFDGRACFSPGDGGLMYVERGVLCLPGQAPMTAERQYLWRQGPGGVEVFFNDGRFFHAIGPGDRPEAMHDCAPDRYHVRYDFAQWPRWTSVWQVSGPRKDYVMRSDFAPAG